MQLDRLWLAQQGQDARLFTYLHASLRGAESPIAVAVSGGGDSMALLHLVAQWGQQVGVQIHCVTVDHTLREGSAQEAQQVAAFCDSLGVAHDTLTWTDWDGHGNVQAAARAARYKLMSDWAVQLGIDDIVLGHTQDDAAETYVMRLARKAGIDGLSLMDGHARRRQVMLHRPLLAVTRGDLRDYLRRHDVGWVDDPSNDDIDFERVRVRKALDTLATVGVTPAVLHHAALTARQARDALDHYTRQEASRIASTQDGDIILHELGALPAEMRRRIWMKAVQWMGRLDYPPRSTTIQHLQDGLALDGRATGGGCLVTNDGGTIRIARETNAVKAMVAATDSHWDRHWTMSGPHAPDLTIRALGEGIRACPDWRETGVPRHSLMATPAVWRGDALIAAPIAGLQNGWTAQIVAEFHEWLNVH